MIKKNFNLFAHFEDQFLSHSDKEILCTEDNFSYSYSKLNKISAQIANCLINSGASENDRVTVQIEKSPWGLALYLACLRSGLVFHPLNMAYKKKEVEYFLSDTLPSNIPVAISNAVDCT